MRRKKKIAALLGAKILFYTFSYIAASNNVAVK